MASATRVLLVDDEPLLLRSLKRLFAVAEPTWRLRIAAGADEALDLLGTEPADVIVTDMVMGAVDGADLLLQVVERWPATIRIVFTGQASAPQMARAAALAHQVIPKTGEVTDLFAAIRRCLASRDELVDAEMRSWVLRSNELPTAPKLWPQLEEALRRTKTTPADLAEIVGQDPAITARVLQLASSAYFGMPQRIRTLEAAIHWMGVTTLRGMVLSVELMRLFHGVPPGLDVDGLAMHGYRTGRLAMAMQRDPETSERAFLAGVIHDIGILVRGTRTPDPLLADLGEAKRTGRPLHEVEAERRGYDHAVVGASLLGLWGLDDGLVSMVRDHHRAPAGPGARFDGAATVALANRLIHEADDGQQDPRIDADAEALGVSDRIHQWRTWARAG